jgi:hypothetical protein
VVAISVALYQVRRYNRRRCYSMAEQPVATFRHNAQQYVGVSDGRRAQRILIHDTVEIIRSHVSFGISHHDEVRAVVVSCTDSTANHTAIV